MTDRIRAGLAVSRLIAGLVQGIALYALYLSSDDKTWPATDPYWLAPLLMVFVFVPLLFMQAVGTMRPRTLLLWTVAATAILAGLAWYDIWRQGLAALRPDCGDERHDVRADRYSPSSDCSLRSR